MANNLPGRAFFQASGKVNWPKFLPWMALSLIVAVLLAFSLNFLFRHSFYLLIVMPVLAAMAMAGTLSLMVNKGHCRSKLIGASIGILTAVIVYLGYFEFGIIRELGVEAVSEPALLPHYIVYRMKSDVIRDTHSSRHEEAKPPGTAGVMLNWGAFVVEFGLILFFSIRAGVRRAGQPYCETCGRWMERELAAFPPEAGANLVEALRLNSVPSLATLLATPQYPGIPNAMAAVHYCPSIKETTFRSCPVFLSIKQVTESPKRVVLDAFEGAPGKLLVTRTKIGDEELPALGMRFKVFEKCPGSGASALSKLITKTEEEKPRTIAVVKPVDPAFAGKVLTTKTAAIKTAIGFATLAGIFIAIGICGLGGTMAFPDHPPVGGVSALAKAAGIIILGSGIALFFSIMVMAFVKPEFFASRYFIGVLKKEFARRPGHLVRPDSPEARLVHVVPRLNWKVMKLEDATDAGFLLVDAQRREVLFEGDKEYYRIPAAAIISCQVESYVSGEGSHGATPIFMVVLRAHDASGILEVPFMDKSSTGKWMRKKREQWACHLQKEIEAIRLATPVVG